MKYSNTAIASGIRIDFKWMSAKYTTNPTMATLAAVVRFESMPTLDSSCMIGW